MRHICRNLSVGEQQGEKETVLIAPQLHLPFGWEKVKAKETYI